MPNWGQVLDEIQAEEVKLNRRAVVLTTHHCFLHSLSLSGASKIVENQNGAMFVKVPV